MLLALIASHQSGNACGCRLDAGFWTYRAISQAEEVFHTAGYLRSIAVADDGQREAVPGAVFFQQSGPWELGYWYGEEGDLHVADINVCYRNLRVPGLHVIPLDQ